MQFNGVTATRSWCHGLLCHSGSALRAESLVTKRPGTIKAETTSTAGKQYYLANLLIRPFASGLAVWIRRIVFQVCLSAAMIEQGLLELLPDDALACST